MTCKEFKYQLTSLKDPRKLTKTMHQHLSECPNCSRDYNQEARVMEFVGNERLVKVSPFLKTRIMAAIEKPVPAPWYSKPALITLFSVIVFIFGVVSAGLLDTSEITDPYGTIASDYYFQDYPGTQLEEFWLNSDYYEK